MNPESQYRLKLEGLHHEGEAQETLCGLAELSACPECPFASASLG